MPAHSAQICLESGCSQHTGSSYFWTHQALFHRGTLARVRRDPSQKSTFFFQILSQMEKNLPPLKFLMEDLSIVHQPSNTLSFASYEMSHLKTERCTDDQGACSSLTSQVSSVIQNVTSLPFSFPKIIHIFGK